MHSINLRPDKGRGFTLLEVITAMSIGMIMLTTGVPAFQSTIQKSRHTTHINTFVSHLHYSRSEAIKRGSRVVMCRSIDEQRCSRSEGWHTGWIIFADTNANRELDSNEDILRVAQGWQDGIEVTSGRRRRVVYQPTGFAPGTNGTYVFCNNDYPELAKAIILSNSGRPRLSTKRPDGSPLPCGD